MINNLQQLLHPPLFVWNIPPAPNHCNFQYLKILKLSTNIFRTAFSPPPSAARSKAGGELHRFWQQKFTLPVLYWQCWEMYHPSLYHYNTFSNIKMGFRCAPKWQPGEVLQCLLTYMCINVYVMKAATTCETWVWQPGGGVWTAMLSQTLIFGLSISLFWEEEG